MIPVQHDPGRVMAKHLPLGSGRLSASGKTWQRFQATHSLGHPLTPPGPRSILELVFKLREMRLQGRALQNQNWRCRRRGREAGREGGQPSFQRLAFDAGAAETSPLPETQGQTDKHRWKERLGLLYLWAGDRPSPVSESLIYQAEETSYPLATLFPPA